MPLLIRLPLVAALIASSSAPISAQVGGGAATSTPPQIAGRQKTCGELSSDLSTAERNQRCVAAAGPLAAYRDGLLTLRMDDGKRKVFKTDASTIDMGAFGYALQNYYPAQRLFVVTNAGVDSGTTIVIDGRTGKVTDYGDGFPFFAPSGRWVMVDESSASSGDPSAFRLFEVDGAKRTERWFSKSDPTTLSSRRFRFLRWDDDTHARFELGRGRSPVLLVRAQDGRWHYDLADDEEADASSTTTDQPAVQLRP